MEFNAKDLNREQLKSRAKAEAQLIYNKPSTRKGRSLETKLQRRVFSSPLKYLI